MIRLLVADDHPVIRRGIRQIVADTPDIMVAAETCNGWNILKKAKENDCNVILLDISIPGRNGLELLREIQADKPDLPVLVLTLHSEEEYGVRAIRAGASGFLSKDSDPGEIVDAIRKVYWGGKYISSSLGEKLANELSVFSEHPRHHELSNREYQTLRLLGAGFSVTAIADQLSLSVKTVSTYRKRILQKMGFKNNAQITNYVIRHSLLEVDLPPQDAFLP